MANPKNKSAEWFERAQRVIPGGVNSPVRAFRAVGGDPRFISHGAGSKIFDIDGRSFIDYVGSWGPLILGHANPEVVAALEKVLRTGTSFGAPTPGEVELAEMVRQAFPSIEKVRLTSSGTEATMSAIRVARAFTGRQTIVKFEGCYHGHADSLLAKAGSGLATFGLPDSAGIPADFTRYTATLPFNDLHAIEDAFAQLKGQIAAVIIEPVVGNMGCVLPRPGFLEALRRITETEGALLIFDEVITGFRIAYGGAQERFGIRADMTTLGKVIGGGLPIGAYGGRAEVMELVAPVGPVYQAGTLSGNPLAVEAGRKTLEILKRPGTYEKLDAMSARMERELDATARAAGVAMRINRLGSMFTLFFTESEVADYASAKRSDTKRFAAFFHAMLERGVYLPPSQFEAAFVSLAHTEEDLDATAAAAREAFLSLKG